MNQVKPIFLLAISPRSGSNYLYRLIARHPQIKEANIKGEDFLLRHSHHLMQHIWGVSNNWKESWGNSKEKLTEEMAMAWYRFLGGNELGDAQRLLTKTPMPHNAGNFLKLFPEGQMVIITRRGPDVVESFVKTFKSSFESAVLRWKKGADHIHLLRKQYPKEEGKAYLVIRYEDLFEQTETTLSKVLEFLNLETAVFPMEEALAQGVIGSSTQADDGAEVSWQSEQEKDENFDPTKRAAQWSIWQRYRFEYLAGERHRELGYKEGEISKGIVYRAYNAWASLRERLSSIF